jgi:ribonuclease HII
MSESNELLITTAKKVKKTVKEPKKEECLVKSFHSYPRFEIGLDEAGRGPLFGRLFVGGVVLPFPEEEGAVDGFHYEWMKDSKKFYSHRKRAEVAAYIRENAVAYHVAYVEAEEIDQINILQAVYKGMHECVQVVSEKLAEKGHQGLWKEESGMFLLVDGNRFEPITRWNSGTERYDVPDFTTVEGGDNTYCSIAAASILAKTAHDEYIMGICRDYPELEVRYGLLKGMGYATKSHLEGIRKHGVSQWHRRTFGETCRNATLCPVGRMLATVEDTGEAVKGAMEYSSTAPSIAPSIAPSTATS